MWLLVTLALDPEKDGRALPDLLDHRDRMAVALALSNAWRYARIPCPQVVAWPVSAGSHRAVLLARLAFAVPPTGGLVGDELETLASAVRHAAVMRGRGSASATVEPAPAADVDQLGEHALEYGQRVEIAERDWWRQALVRLRRDVSTSSPFVDRPAHHRAGKVLTLQQSGRKHWPIDTTGWRTSSDIDLTSFVPDEAVEVVKALQETPPLLADAIEPAHARLAGRWARAMAWSSTPPATAARASAIGSWCTSTARRSREPFATRSSGSAETAPTPSPPGSSPSITELPTAPTSPPAARPRMEYLSGPFAEHYQGANPLIGADVAEVRRRLRELRPAFERLGRGHWLDYSLHALDQLAGNTSGARNLIAGPGARHLASAGKEGT
ncbi:hypothetical protein HII36_48290 [Nonomuraea sp. NN258]|uniref:hypothetical protein n=1 Tax=Nonomuraea antri TaxID=2730852 RepID=UPI001568183A|nr:hypothetical protein [Nonomuraea antri]NRQ39579.1 hypothetical protein [Nonomuraea antri]